LCKILSFILILDNRYYWLTSPVTNGSRLATGMENKWVLLF
jgi:hypothetical protein